MALYNLYLTEKQRDNYGMAGSLVEEALDISRATGQRDGEPGYLNSLGERARMLGDYQLAANYYQGAVQISHESGNQAREAVYSSNLAGVLVGLGQYQQAEAHLRQALHLTEMAVPESVDWFLSEMYSFMALALLGQDRVSEALAAARLALVRRSGTEPGVMGIAWRALGLIAAQLAESITIDGRLLDARACFAASLDEFTTAHLEAERARTLREWGRYEIEQGDSERGAAVWQEARDIFGRLGLELEVARMDQPVHSPEILVQ